LAAQQVRLQPDDYLLPANCLSLFMPIYQLGDVSPTIHESAFLTDSVTVIGEVTIKANANIWYGVVIRGDTEPIVIGENSNVQEGTTLHTDHGCPLIIGDNVTVGHQAMLHGCIIGDGSLIGIQAVVLNDAKIGRNCLVGAGSLVTEGKEFPDNSLIIGSPARAVRTLTEAELDRMKQSAEMYTARARQYREQLKRIG
jgi:carbonic anhydrase/acetyltransferase-like protein (isoleucine patch superfamily)